MKNINTQHIRSCLTSPSNDNIDRFVYDEFGSKVYLLTRERTFVEAFVDRKTFALTTSEQRDISGDILPEQEIVNMILHKFNNKIIFVMKDGAIAVIDLANYELEVIGEQESGFLAAELSPCEELLVLATGANSLILFDKEFNLIDEKPMDDGEGTSGSDLSVSVCRIAWRFDSNVSYYYYSVFQCVVRWSQYGNESTHQG